MTRKNNIYKLLCATTVKNWLDFSFSRDKERDQEMKILTVHKVIEEERNPFVSFQAFNGPCHVSGIFLPLRVNSLPLATIYEVKIPLRKWKISLLQRNPAQMTWHHA
jgi:hypothetical protein